jgi:hypothetical protein
MVAQSIPHPAEVGFRRYNAVINQALQWIVLVYQAVAVVVFLAALFIANRWFQQPFLGAFYEHTMVFNGTGPSQPDPAWALVENVRVGDQLVAIDGVRVTSSSDVRDILRGRFPGEQVNVTVRLQNGDLRNHVLTLYAFPEASRTLYFIVPSILGAVFLAVSLWIFGLRRNEPAGRAFSLFTSSLAIVTGTYFNLITTHEFTYLWTLACVLTGGGLINLALVFPVEPRSVIRRPYLRWSGIVIGLLLALFAFPTLFNFEQPAEYIHRWQYIYAFVFLSIVIYLGSNLYHVIYAQSPVVKTQTRTILLGTVAAFMPMGVWLGAGSLSPRLLHSSRW